MRIIYFSPHPTHDIVSDVGYSTHQREMIAALREIGHEVIPVIIGGIEPRDVRVHATTDGNKVLSWVKALLPGILWRTFKDFRLIWHDKYRSGPRLKRAIDEHAPDLIYERSEYLLGSGTKISKEHGVPHILEVNAPCVEEWIEFEGASLLTGFAHQVERKKLQRATGLCPVSSPLAHYIRDEYYLDEQRIQFIPNAINPNSVSAALHSDQSLSERLNIHPSETVVGFIGSILEYHGVDLLLEAFHLVQKEVQNVRLLVVGDGALLTTLRSRTEELGIANKVQFTDRVPHNEVYDYMNVMDICVNPAHSWYGSPIKTFEYGAMAKPIIAPDTANMRDVLEHNKTAWLAKTDVESLAKAIRQLCLHKKEGSLMGEAFKEQVMTQHTWISNAKRVEKFAQQIIENK
jgi:glycosyltransferase involved in cell wall biosynthesis